MRVEYINPFVETSYSVLKEVLGGTHTENVEALIVPLISECGKIEVNVAIRERT